MFCESHNIKLLLYQVFSPDCFFLSPLPKLRRQDSNRSIAKSSAVKKYHIIYNLTKSAYKKYSLPYKISPFVDFMHKLKADFYKPMSIT